LILAECGEFGDALSQVALRDDGIAAVNAFGLVTDELHRD
jgi:hypothetical protein